MPGRSWRTCSFHNNLHATSKMNSGKQSKDRSLAQRPLSKGPKHSLCPRISSYFAYCTYFTDVILFKSMAMYEVNISLFTD